MARIDGRTLREWRRARGWDVPETARRLRLAARGAGQSTAALDGLIRMIQAWERGDHDLSERYELLYRRLGLTSETTTSDPAADAAGLHAGGPRLLDELTGHAVEFGRWAETANAGPGTIAQLDDAIHRIAREYLNVPPWPLLHRAGEITSRVFRLLRGHQRLRHARDLYVTGAKCCAFLAWAAGDLGHLAAAAAHGRTALILAREADHPGAEALALCALSKTSYWDGRLSRAAALARQGWERCPPNSTRVLLACQESDAADAAGARSAMARARHARDDAAAADDLGGIFSCGGVRLANYTASFHLKDDNPDAALTAADSAIAAPGEEIGYGTWGQLHITAAIALLTKGEPEGAAERLAPVLALPASRRLATLTMRLGAIHPLLTGRGYSADAHARALAWQITAYCDEAAGATRLALPAGEEEE
ncbi:MAG TPA: hypothetical protein VKV35_02470 [Streptosporangiaceae bacterium]|jgi:hypothetical protein|nr:hypothetical protein [Streptosporangiaceae bacterium]